MRIEAWVEQVLGRGPAGFRGVFPGMSARELEQLEGKPQHTEHRRWSYRRVVGAGREDISVTRSASERVAALRYFLVLPDQKLAGAVARALRQALTDRLRPGQRDRRFMTFYLDGEHRGRAHTCFSKEKGPLGAPDTGTVMVAVDGYHALRTQPSWTRNWRHWARDTTTIERTKRRPITSPTPTWCSSRGLWRSPTLLWATTCYEWSKSTMKRPPNDSLRAWSELSPRACASPAPATQRARCGWESAALLG